MRDINIATAEQVIIYFELAELTESMKPDAVRHAMKAARQWLYRNWINTPDPAPHFRCGDRLFFEIGELEAWAKRRSLGSDSTSTEAEPMD
ncbi:MAG: hypothetical protein AAGF31_13005 [Planctomycetota bacterium]